MVEVRGNPKDSMKSTWRHASRNEWTIYHKFFDFFDVHPTWLDRDPPVFSKQEKVPHLPNWHLARWVILYAFVPLALHEAYVYITGQNLHLIGTFFLYNISMKLTAIHEVRILRRIGYIHGFLDGDKHGRDDIPDVGVTKTFFSLTLGTDFRAMLAMILTYRASQAPSSINWAWLPVEIGIYPVVLDFWFYWYHRLMHEVDSLWKFHRTHHLTKHPNPLLTLYADTTQEFFDIIGIPLITYGTMKALGFPMGFYEYWICHSFVLFTEILGHSGLRVHLSPPSTITWLLTFLDVELILEDHDLHHRSGWRKSHNYGKQTRVWDRLFGTCTNRIESTSDNIDYVNTATMPLI